MAIVPLGQNSQQTQPQEQLRCHIPTFGQALSLEVPGNKLIGIGSWSRIRQTEGWAGLQHHCVLHTTLTIIPPTNLNHDGSTLSPRLHVNLVQGSFFTILPRPSGDRIPRWYSGNIYSMERSLSRIIDLPSAPSFASPTTYDVFVSGDYEARDLSWNS